ncbi:hypothetical protein DPMN_131923 [Dreissena polymorpha]|uniref:Uncharacterized protein n=1 Tax=Dreissena polymorpha TaxID=45954 RepID=A0A9D4FXC5_DREPO|nr:hypothetical protein DPMN_131923 [Dreissena polymorpha]
MAAIESKPWTVTVLKKIYTTDEMVWPSNIDRVRLYGGHPHPVYVYVGGAALLH